MYGIRLHTRPDDIERLQYFWHRQRQAQLATRRTCLDEVAQATANILCISEALLLSLFLGEQASWRTPVPETQ